MTGFVYGAAGRLAAYVIVSPTNKIDKLTSYTPANSGLTWYPNFDYS